MANNGKTPDFDTLFQTAHNAAEKLAILERSEDNNVKPTVSPGNALEQQEQAIKDAQKIYIETLNTLVKAGAKKEDILGENSTSYEQFLMQATRKIVRNHNLKLDYYASSDRDAPVPSHTNNKEETPAIQRELRAKEAEIKQHSGLFPIQEPKKAAPIIKQPESQKPLPATPTTQSNQVAIAKLRTTEPNKLTPKTTPMAKEKLAANTKLEAHFNQPMKSTPTYLHHDEPSKELNLQGFNLGKTAIDNSTKDTKVTTGNIANLRNFLQNKSEKSKTMLADTDNSSTSLSAVSYSNSPNVTINNTSNTSQVSVSHTNTNNVNSNNSITTTNTTNIIQQNFIDALSNAKTAGVNAKDQQEAYKTALFALIDHAGIKQEKDNTYSKKSTAKIQTLIENTLDSNSLKLTYADAKEAYGKESTTSNQTASNQSNSKDSAKVSTTVATTTTTKSEFKATQEMIAALKLLDVGTATKNSIQGYGFNTGEKHADGKIGEMELKILLGLDSNYQGAAQQRIETTRATIRKAFGLKEGESITKEQLEATAKAANITLDDAAKTAQAINKAPDKSATATTQHASPTITHYETPQACAPVMQQSMSCVPQAVSYECTPCTTAPHCVPTQQHVGPVRRLLGAIRNHRQGH